MRSLETLLLLADLLTLVVLSFARLRASRWLRLSAAVALLIAAAQVGVEGPRWQMVPAYVLTALFLLVWALKDVTPAGGLAERFRLPQLAAGLGFVCLAGAAALPMLVPVFGFRTPTGPHAIGTLTTHWVDASRAEVFASDPNARRQLMVQIWYPAQADPSARRAAYLADAAAVTAVFARIHDMPRFIFGHLQYVTTNAMLSVPAAGDQPTYPVLLFLAGATGFRQMNTFQVEQLVSYGYIVIALDQPGAAATVVFPDGHQAAGLTLAQLQAAVGPSYLPGRSAQDNRLIPYLTQDVVFALDQLAALNRADPHGILTGRLALQHVGIFGVSLGGIVVGEACRLDARLQACLVMDAPMSTAVVQAGLHQPSLWITRDAASMRLERQRAGGWSEAEIEAHQTSMRAVYAGLSGDGYFVRVPGMFHSNFTDIPNWTPLARQLGLAGPLDQQRAHDIINAYSLAFFDRHLQGRPAKLLDGPAKQFPEVMFESRRP